MQRQDTFPSACNSLTDSAAMKKAPQWLFTNDSQLKKKLKKTLLQL